MSNGGDSRASGGDQGVDLTRNAGPRWGAITAGVAAAGAAAAAYMFFEAQWVQCREQELAVPGLPTPWSGLTVLHLSDVHAGLFQSNNRSLAKVVRWAEPLAPDLVFLTGDILGDPEHSRPCLELLARLSPPLGMFAVTGNHEYGLSKAPLARMRDTRRLWEKAGITLLSDSCVSLPARQGASIVLCGADYLSGGYGLLDGATPDGATPDGATPDGVTPSDAVSGASALQGAPGAEAGGTGALDAAPTHAGADAPGRPLGDFPILLIHDPPASDSPLAPLFPLAFAGHTHGGQLRVPARSGLTPLAMEGSEFLSGVYPWGRGLLVISQGIGTSFLPLRLLTRPEATLWRLVYTSSRRHDARDS